MSKVHGGGRHPLMLQMRALRQALGLSLDTLSARLRVTSVALGSWERGDRQPTLGAVDQVLAEFGYELRAVPIGSTIRPAADDTSVLTCEEMIGHLHHVITQLERNGRVQPADPTSLAGLRQRLGASAMGDVA